MPADPLDAAAVPASVRADGDAWLVAWGDGSEQPVRGLDLAQLMTAGNSRAVAALEQAFSEVLRASEVLSGATLERAARLTQDLGEVIAAAQARDIPNPTDPTSSAQPGDLSPSSEEETPLPNEIAREGEQLAYVVTKAHEEQRYTFGPLYAPDRLDAHGEYTDAETLQQAVWQYVEQSSPAGRRLRLQHGEDGVTIGSWLEVVSWPYETRVKVTVPGTGETKEVDLPAGTVYMGVRWDEAAWPSVKSGALAGLSMGGRAVRVQEDGAPALAMGG